MQPVHYNETSPHLPRRKRNEAVACNAQPKMRTKPSGIDGFTREVASCTAEERKRKRESLWEMGAGDSRELPWDLRGPPRGPTGGAPTHWRGQKWREGSGR